MPLPYPDIFVPNNPNNAQLDSIHLRGGRRAVATLQDLYALNSKRDQLAENVTIVRVTSLEKDYLLKNINQVGASQGWEEYNTGNVITTGNFINTIEFLVGSSQFPTDSNTYSNPQLVGRKIQVQLDGSRLPSVVIADRQHYTFDSVNGIITFKDVVVVGQYLQIDIYS